MTQLLKGNIVAEEIYTAIESDISLLGKHNIVPKLAIVCANSDEGSGFYERSLVKKCIEVGIPNRIIHFDENSCTTSEIIDAVSNYCNQAYSILVLEPLPAHVDKNAILNAIDPNMDADCMTDVSLGKLFSGSGKIAPCTAMSVIKILDYYDYDLEGKDVCIIGRSNIVGKPLSLLMTDRNATVTLCHSKTVDLAKYTKRSDIVVFATGSPEKFGKEYVEETSIVIDVGTTLNDDGKYVGDVKFNELNGYVSAITPVRGGVGACTTACLLQNVVECAKVV